MSELEHTPQRNDRQAHILPQADLDRSRCIVIGVGAVGYNVTLTLAAMGVGNLLLVDSDVVNVENQSSQGWKDRQIGQLKVNAAAAECSEVNSKYGTILPGQFTASHIEVVPERFAIRSPKELAIGEDPEVLDYVFSCVDSIKTRSNIFESLKNRNVPFIVDGRMALSSCQVLASTSEEDRKYYAKSFFAEEESYRAIGQCTVQSTLHVAKLCACLMVEAYSKSIQGKPQSRHFGIDLLSMDATYEMF